MRSGKNITRLVALGLAALTTAGVAVGASTAQATPAQQSAPHTSYSKHDLVDLFAFGSGPAAAAHPEIVKALLGGVPKVSPSPQAVDDFTKRLEATDPNFDSRVLPELTSHDPMQTQSALAQFATDTNNAVKSAPTTVPGEAARPNDVFYLENNVAIVNQAVQSLSVVTSYVGAAEFVAVFFYRFTEGVNGLDKDQAVSDVAGAFV